MLDIWTIPFSEPALTKEVLSLLSEEEHKKAKAFVQERDSRAYLLSHFYLRKIFSFYFPSVSPSQWSYRYNAYGKPSLVGKEGFHFNLSHAHSCAYVICSDEGVCGIDVEEKRNLEITENLATLIFSKNELALYEKSQAKEGLFYQVWTLKEAHLKAVGTGLMEMPLASLCFADKLSLHSKERVFNKGKQRYWTQRVNEEQYVAACLLNSRKESPLRYRSIGALIEKQ